MIQPMRNKLSGYIFNNVIAFQCLLSIWKQGVTKVYCSLNSIVINGSHFTLKLKATAVKLVSKNILPSTLNTKVSLSNGNVSSMHFFDKQ